jgi:hypothetical protein
MAPSLAVFFFRQRPLALGLVAASMPRRIRIFGPLPSLLLVQQPAPLVVVGPQTIGRTGNLPSIAGVFCPACTAALVWPPPASTIQVTTA